MKIKPGMRFEDRVSGRIIIVTRRGGNKHWNCQCGKRNHKLHEGTLEKFYKEVTE